MVNPNTYQHDGPIARAAAIKYLTTNEAFLTSETFKSFATSVLQIVSAFTEWQQKRPRITAMHAAYRAKTRRRNRKRK